MNSLASIWAKRGVNPALLVVWGLAAALVLWVLVRGGYLTSVVQIAAIYTIFVTGLNIFMGYAGQVSFGHNAFAAVSGYTSAVLTATYNWSPLPAAAVGLAGVLVFALVIGYPTLRLRGHYLAMATLAIGLIAYDVAVEWDSVTQGYMGISGIPPLGIGRWVVASDRAILVLLIVLAGIGVLAAAGIRRSRLGRAIVAVAGSENAARALGIDVAFGLHDLGRLRRRRRLAVRAHRRLRQPGSLRPAHGRARLHHALYRRHRHVCRPGARRPDRDAVAGDLSHLQ
jgi:branched-chain amino acid transport system permease protein